MDLHAGRRFTLADAMVLVGATAIGFDLMHVCLTKAAHAWGPWDRAKSSLWLVACWTLAVPLLHLRGPRPALARLARRPGFVGCVAALVGLAFSAVGWLPTLLSPIWQTSIGRPLLWVTSPYRVAPAVVAAWMTLAMGGRWRPEAGWLDRFGRGLGVFWIGAAVVDRLLEVASIWFR
jgi:hypothetical protein